MVKAYSPDSDGSITSYNATQVEETPEGIILKDDTGHICWDLRKSGEDSNQQGWFKYKIFPEQD